MMCSLVFDYLVRQKVGGANINTYIVKQIAVLSPEQFSSDIVTQILIRVAKLCYYNHDLDDWAEDLWNRMDDKQKQALPEIGAKTPYEYNVNDRAILQAELDAIYARLYGLSTEDLQYLLDPEDVCGPGCINETFRVLKDNEIRQYGEYRTKRLVMEAWRRFGYDD